MLSAIAAFSLLPLLLASPIGTPAKRQDGHSYSLIQAQRDGLCLTVQAPNPNSLTDGLPVVSGPCETATIWDIYRGSGSVVVTGTTFALDAGEWPGNNGALKVWTSYPGLYQQTWYWTDDNRIAITGGDQCLDEGDNGIQTYQCTTGNTNQIFNVIPAPNHVTQIPGEPTSIVDPPPQVTSSIIDPPPVTVIEGSQPPPQVTSTSSYPGHYSDFTTYDIPVPTDATTPPIGLPSSSEVVIVTSSLGGFVPATTAA